MNNIDEKTKGQHMKKLILIFLFSSTLHAQTTPVVCASKSQLATATASIKAAIIASCGQPAPPPPPPTGGIFIGTTQYQHLADAGAAYKPGDTIHITKSQDSESTALVNGDVTVLCDPGVKLTWSKGVALRLAWGKGIFDVEGATLNFTISNCEISGAVLNTADGGNGAAVRIIDGVNTATFTNVNFHDGNNGILGAAKTTTVTNSKFANNGVGGAGNTHNVYFSAFADQVTVSNSTFGAVNIGNLFKSRAKSTTVTNCIFNSLGQDGSYEIDIPNGGNTLVANSIVVKAPGQSQHYILEYGQEGLIADGRSNTFEFRNNIVIADDVGHFINALSGPTYNFHDNVIAGNIDGIIGTNKVYPDRVSAGLPAAPALPSLPVTASLKK